MSIGGPRVPRVSFGKPEPVEAAPPKPLYYRILDLALACGELAGGELVSVTLSPQAFEALRAEDPVLSNFSSAATWVVMQTTAGPVRVIRAVPVEEEGVSRETHEEDVFTRAVTVEYAIQRWAASTLLRYHDNPNGTPFSVNWAKTNCSPHTLVRAVTPEEAHRLEAQAAAEAMGADPSPEPTVDVGRLGDVEEFVEAHQSRLDELEQALRGRYKSSEQLEARVRRLELGIERQTQEAVASVLGRAAQALEDDAGGE